VSKPVTFKRLLAILDRTFAGLPDPRTGQNTIYTMRDAAMAGFSVFFMQSPSFLAHQEAMQQSKGHSNAASLFGLERIPSDPQIRNLLDPVDARRLSPPRSGRSSTLWKRLANWLLTAAWRVTGWSPWTARSTFPSTKIHCQRCTVTVHNDTEYYAHTAITPVLVGAGRVAGDCLGTRVHPAARWPREAGLRAQCGQALAGRQAQQLAGHRVTLLGDDLYCNQPFCEGVLAQKLNFIFTCKPDSHETLYEEVGLVEPPGAVTKLTQRHWNGKTHEVWRYRYVNDVPLRAGAAALKVNWCELTIVQEDTGEQLYHNAFATNHRLTDASVAPLSPPAEPAGRSRTRTTMCSRTTATIWSTTSVMASSTSL
jgi:hypothetical protein